MVNSSIIHFSSTRASSQNYIKFYKISFQIVMNRHNNTENNLSLFREGWIISNCSHLVAMVKLNCSQVSSIIKSKVQSKVVKEIYQYSIINIWGIVLHQRKTKCLWRRHDEILKSWIRKLFYWDVNSMMLEEKLKFEIV